MLRVNLQHEHVGVRSGHGGRRRPRIRGYLVGDRWASMATGSGRDAELTVAVEGVDGERVSSWRREVGGEGSADGGRGGHGEVELTVAAARAEERG